LSVSTNNPNSRIGHKKISINDIKDNDIEDDIKKFVIKNLKKSKDLYKYGKLEI
jgi:hypothetical protein